MDGHEIMKAGILLSGGMDSIALTWWKKPEVAYTVDYGQKSANGEVRAAGAVCSTMDIVHRVLQVDCSCLGSGDLAGSEPNFLAPSPEWWPFRNQLLLTLALMAAVQDGISRLLFGAVKTDSFHQDGSVDFFRQIGRLVALQEGNIAIEAPALSMTSAELVRASGVDASVLSWAHSCHKSDFACGRCRGCEKHRLVMTELGYGAY